MTHVFPITTDGIDPADATARGFDPAPKLDAVPAVGAPADATGPSARRGESE